MATLDTDVLKHILYFTGEPWSTCLVCKEWNNAQQELINTTLMQISLFYESNRDPLHIRQILVTTTTPSKKLANIFLNLTRATDITAVSLPHASAEKHNARIKEIELHDLLAFWRLLPDSESYFALPENQDLTDSEHATNFPRWAKEFQDQMERVREGDLVRTVVDISIKVQRLPHEIYLLDRLVRIQMPLSAFQCLPDSFFTLPNLSRMRIDGPLDAKGHSDYFKTMNTAKALAEHVSLPKLLSLINLRTINGIINRKKLTDEIGNSYSFDQQFQTANEIFNSYSFDQQLLITFLAHYQLSVKKEEILDISYLTSPQKQEESSKHIFDDLELFYQIVSEVQSGDHDKLLNSFRVLVLYNSL